MFNDLRSLFVAMCAGLAIGFCAIAPGFPQDTKPFRLGGIHNGNAESSMARLQPFARSLETVLQTTVTIATFRDYSTLIDAQISGRIDYAIYSSSAYAEAWRLCNCVEPLVSPKAGDGSTGIASVLLVRGDEITSLARLAGKSIAYPGLQSLSGYKIPVMALEQQGVLNGDSGIELVDYNSTGKAINAFENGEANGLFGWMPAGAPVTAESAIGTLAALKQGKGKAGSGIRILWSSQPYRYGPHAIRNDVPVATKILLRGHLEHLQESNPQAYDSVEPILGGGFAVARHQDYLTFLELAEFWHRISTVDGAAPSR